MKKLISVILPTYNEAENIVPLISEVKKNLIKYRYEIIVVDDDSPDGTSIIVSKFIKEKKFKNVKIITRKTNHGLTNSIWEGITKSKGEIIVWLDCDFSHPPILIPKLISNIEKGNDMAVASRFIKGGGYKKNTQDTLDSPLAIFLSRIMNYFVQILLGGGFRDYTSGFIAVRRSVFKDIKLSGDYGEYFIDLMVRAILLKYKFIEIPFVNLPRRYGESKTGSDIIKLSKRGIKYIVTAIKLIFLKLAYKIKLTNDIKSQRKRFK